MGQRRLYSEEEDEYIRQHYASTPHRDIADELGRTVKSVRRRAEKIRCPKSKPVRRFSAEEDKFILSSKGRLLAEVAGTLGRDPSDVLKRAHRLGFVSWRRPEGGNYVTNRGYEVRSFDQGKPVYEHRAVIEDSIGRKLSPDERVYHIDTDKRNNRSENLFLFPSPAGHAACHATLNALVGENADVPELLRVGAICFDRDKGVYRCGKEVF